MLVLIEHCSLALCRALKGGEVLQSHCLILKLLYLGYCRVVEEHPQRRNQNNRRKMEMMMRKRRMKKRMMMMKMMSERGPVWGRGIPTRSKPVHNVTK